MAQPERPGSGDPSIDAATGKEPIIKKIGNVYVVGVNHLDAPSMTLAYCEAVRNADHLILESSYQHAEPYSHEGVAHRFFREEKGSGTIHSIEGGVDVDTLFVQAGMDPQLVGYRFIHGFLSGSLVRGGWVNNPEKMDTEIAALGDHLKGFSSIYRDLSDEQLRHNLHGWTDATFDGFLQGKDFGTPSKIIGEYQLQVRDAALFVPKVQQWTRDLPGVKTVMIGKDHVPAVEAALRGEAVPVPPSWPEYVQGLDPEKRRGVEIFSAMAKFPGEQTTDKGTKSGPATHGKVIGFSSGSPAERSVVVKIDKTPRKRFFK